MIPADTEVTCPVCDTDFVVKKLVREEETVDCENCNATLILIDDDLEEKEEDIFEDEDEYVEDTDEKDVEDDDDIHS